ncbi:hypothetical protein [Hydrogenophaga sp.]|uniref:hypothetical protein n=1 Tax=Hydrogenophaga sp. TaxID=1904254 RepID=UPI0027329161|nr:hypothetical protein [Hydrogenophaga sp.]MDP2987174.1 hypothetical protein [Hydrogenophaga sp.]MDP3627967.1 hypothetical protein [Hydrogenophaga sp.]
MVARADHFVGASGDWQGQQRTPSLSINGGRLESDVRLNQRQATQRLLRVLSIEVDPVAERRFSVGLELQGISVRKIEIWIFVAGLGSRG